MRPFALLAALFAATCVSMASCHDGSDSGDGESPVPCGGVGGSGGSDEQPDAGEPKPDWCSSVACAGGDCKPLACEPCATAPANEPWCGADSPCKALGMEAMGCAWNSAADASCVEMGAYLCGEQGRIVCCPAAPKPVPVCEDMGAAQCPVIGECMEAYCTVGGCAYGQMGQGNVCGDGTKVCHNGICQ